MVVVVVLTVVVVMEVVVELFVVVVVLTEVVVAIVVIVPVKKDTFQSHLVSIVLVYGPEWSKKTLQYSFYQVLKIDKYADQLNIFLQVQWYFNSYDSMCKLFHLLTNDNFSNEQKVT